MLYFYHSDHLGSSTFLSDINGHPYEFFLYLPFGETMAQQNAAGWETPYKFTGKVADTDSSVSKMDPETGIYYFGARYYDPHISLWMSVDPLADDEPAYYSPYNAMWNNPILNVDPDGCWANPVYSSDGTYKGDTKEGFTGEVIIYNGKKDFSKMSKDDLLKEKGASTYDNTRSTLTNDAKSKIWTNIAWHFEGLQVNDEKFTMNDMKDKKIHFGGSGGWTSSWVLGAGKGKISGSDGYSYETTVENVASSIIVHEWYTHIKKENCDNMKSHRLAYKNVINYKYFWNNTTDSYKGFNVNRLKDYTIRESGGKKTQVDNLYRNLYKKYTKYSW